MLFVLFDSYYELVCLSTTPLNEKRSMWACTVVKAIIH